MAGFGGRRPHLNAPPAVEHGLAVNLEHLSLIDGRTDTDSSLSSSDLGRVELELNHLLCIHGKRPAREPPAQTQDEEPFVKIGAGSCGTIIAQPSQPFVVKVSRADQQEALWNDYLKHAKVAKCFGTYEFDDVSIPACHCTSNSSCLYPLSVASGGLRSNFAPELLPSPSSTGNYRLTLYDRLRAARDTTLLRAAAGHP